MSVRKGPGGTQMAWWEHPLWVSSPLGLRSSAAALSMAPKPAQSSLTPADCVLHQSHHRKPFPESCCYCRCSFQLFTATLHPRSPSLASPPACRLPLPGAIAENLLYTARLSIWGAEEVKGSWGFNYLGHGVGGESPGQRNSSGSAEKWGLG